jgi:hypothetical protein
MSREKCDRPQQAAEEVPNLSFSGLTGESTLSEILHETWIPAFAGMTGEGAKYFLSSLLGGVFLFQPCQLAVELSYPLAH